MIAAGRRFPVGCWAAWLRRPLFDQPDELLQGGGPICQAFPSTAPATISIAVVSEALEYFTHRSTSVHFRLTYYQLTS